MGRRVWVPVVSGPLAPFAAGFEAWLRSRAYSSSATADRMCQFDQLSRWLEREGLGVDGLTAENEARFVGSRRARGLVSWVSPRSMALPLEYLRELGVVSAAVVPVPEGPLEELMADYRRFLLVERRLSQHTVLDAYEPAARLFLAGWEGSDGLGLERLSAADVTAFLVRECPRRSVSGARDLGRAQVVLRYLHLAGVIELPLVWAVPAVADLRDRRSARLDRRRSSGCGQCDRRRTVGRRDTRSCCCWRGSGCAQARSPRSPWTTSTGGPALLVHGKGSRQVSCRCRSIW